MDMEKINDAELKLFVDSVCNYFKVVTHNEPQITSAFLATGEIEAHGFSGVVPKPFRVNDLAKVLSATLAMRK